jgi:AraC-like DNA-binding protein
MPRRDHGIGGRVRLHLQRSQPQWPDLERTAQALAMSAATLQRHLAAESTSFQALKDQLRREIAIYRLHTSRVPLAKLAAELGFADSSSFQHAFKSWTGAPPGRYRRGGA